MSLVKDQAQNFMNKNSKIIKSNKESEYWNGVVSCLVEEQLLKEEDMKLIKEFLLNEENQLFSKEFLLSDQETEAFTKILLERIFETKKLFHEKNSAVYKKMLRYFDEEKKNYDEKYIKNFYEDVRKYYVFCHIYQDKYKLLREKFESRVYYKKYGKSSVFPGGHYCHSPIMDLMYSNVQRVGFMKEKPESMAGKVEYDYDEQGRLIMYKHYCSEEELYFCEFLLYVKEWIMDIYYAEEGIERITLRKYRDNLIEEYVSAYVAPWWIGPMKGMCFRINKGSYGYSEHGILETAMEEEYNFPKLCPEGSTPERLIRTKMLFEYDEEGIVSFSMQESVGDYVEKPSIFIKLNEKERRSTKKNKDRWKRPNYFEK